MSEAEMDDLDGVAIVGMSLRVPGAADLETYWHNLIHGVESISEFSMAELRTAGVPAAELEDPSYIRARGALDGAELFDAEFFGLTPREAETMDPQHRLMLEQAWLALEHSGTTAQDFDGSIAMFAGSNVTSYLIHNLAPNPRLVQSIGPLQLRIRNDKDFLATLVSYKLDLKGPSINVQTACSSSLVAVCAACQGLLSYQCDMAVAGGVSVTAPPRSGYLFQEGVYAPDGHCRPFDAEARGTVLGDGVGAVVLKRLEEALEDGDTIHAVIRGFATNNDGSMKLDYTAPSVEGQAEVIGMAHAIGELDPRSVTYIEAHGTGTPLGDPIEIAALTQAFRDGGAEENQFCAIGSVKSNIGHLDAASGVASLIKVVLALKHRQLPPSLNFERPNPHIPFDSSPFFVNAELREWHSDQPLRAGVSSFGVGGTNAHLVVEEAPPAASERSHGPQLLVLSARTSTALEEATARLGRELESRPEENLADVAFTLQVGRRPFTHRRALVAASREEAIAALVGDRRSLLLSAEVGKKRPALTFMFSGVGDQYLGMGQQLYREQEVFRQTFDRGAELLRAELGLDLRQVLWPADLEAAPAGSEMARWLGRASKPADPRAEQLERTAILHPAMALLQLALAHQWMAWGARPESLIGYSVGEYTAAILAGVMTEADGLRLIARRARIVDQLPGGSMLAVTLAEAETRQLLTGNLALAAVNGGAFCVVAGPGDEVERLASDLEGRGVVCRRLRARHAFHSPMMDAGLPEFTELVQEIDLAVPEIPMLSNVSGGWLEPDEATDPAYWARHLCSTVRFGDGIDELWRQPQRVLLEIGPGQTLSSVALQSRPAEYSGGAAVQSLPHGDDRQGEQACMLLALARLWLAGVTPEWRQVHTEARRRVPLPGYAFDRTRYWIDPVTTHAAAAEPVAAPAAGVGSWLYQQGWKRGRREPMFEERSGPFCLLAGSSPLDEALASRLEARGETVVVVVPNPEAERLGENRYGLPVASREAFAWLLEELRNRRLLPRQLVHTWCQGDIENRDDHEETAREHGFYTLLALAQCWGEVGADQSLELTVLTSGTCDVLGDEPLVPDRAILIGPCLVIPQEYPTLSCRRIDIPAGFGEQSSAELDLLEAELLAGDSPCVALRGRHRWLPQLEMLPATAPPSSATVLDAATVPDAPTVLDATTVLETEGVYLVTGGLGGIGSTLAQRLFERCRARLVLTGRSELPAEESWDQEAALDGETAVRIRRAQALRALGAEVMVQAADVTDLDSMRALRRAIFERFGRLDGIVHAAGEPPGGMIQVKSRAAADVVLAPKVRGSRVLEQVFGDDDLDFWLLCSSLTATTGALGLIDHCAANAFLDLHAQQAARQGRPMVSLAWDTWLEVGQAAAAGVDRRLNALFGGGGGGSDAHGGHPLLGRRLTPSDGAEGAEIYRMTLTADSHWLLREHRLADVGLIPGTAWLELARAAVGSRLADRELVLREVLFSEPCLVPDGSAVELESRLEPHGDGFSLSVASSLDGRQRRHMQARLELATANGASAPELADVRDRCAPRPSTALRPAEDSAVSFGPRWVEAVRALRCGENEGWAELELAAEHHSDLDELPLHPALLDVATGLGRVLDSGTYMPVAYEEVRIHRPPTPRLECHFRRRPSAGNDTSTFDVVVVDDQGRQCVSVSGYTLRRLDQQMMIAPRATPPPPSASFGLRPEEGAEVFDRLLSVWPDSSHVVVSVRPVKEVLAAADRLTGEGVTKHMELLQAASGGSTGTGARTVATELVAPRNDLESRLVGLFQEMLGIDQVGIHDNFFDLGGNSLVATQLISRLRDEFAVDLVLRHLFEQPTAAELAVLIVQQQSTAVAEDELMRALAEVRELAGSPADEERLSDE